MGLSPRGPELPLADFKVQRQQGKIYRHAIGASVHLLGCACNHFSEIDMHRGRDAKWHTSVILLQTKWKSLLQKKKKNEALIAVET